MNIPLLADQPFADKLSIDGAVRYSDYSTTGSATTWKAGLTWAPVYDLRLSGTIAEATRAPNIGELFDPGGQTFQFIDDPCDIRNLNQGTEFRAANCAALLTSLGVDPATYVDPNSASIPGSLVGNPDLAEEVAESLRSASSTVRAGRSGLRFKIDYYDIELTDAINTASPAVRPRTSAWTCRRSTTSSAACRPASRGVGGVIDFVQRPLNVAKFTTEGYDFEVGYQLDSSALAGGRDYGMFTFRLLGNKLEDLTFINLPGAQPDEDLGQGPIDEENEAPEWQAIFDVGWERRSALPQLRVLVV